MSIKIAASSLKLIPFPKKISFTGKGFRWQPGDRLMLAPESGPGDFDALTVLADEMEKYGVPRPLPDRASPGQNQRRGLHARYGLKSKHGEEGYSLLVSDKGVDLEAGTPAGIFYGVQTMRQVARCCKGHWPGLVIEDKPVLPCRGLSISMSQGTMARPETIAEWIEHLASYKLNVLQLYMDGGFEFASHPEIDADMVCYNAENMLKLDSLCARYHIDFQPSLNSFGHAGGHLLALPKYRPLAETKTGNSFCPTDPRAYDFLADLYADYLPLFRSKYLNAGCDEVWDLGTGRSRRTAQRIGMAPLFVNHVIKLQKLAARYGKRIQIWGDLVRHIPEILDLLPKDVIILNWEYNQQGVREHPWIFEATRYFRSRGFEVWGAPGVHNWGSLMTRHYTAAQNIRDQARALARYGGKGLLNTDWNEGGPPRLPGTGFHGYALGAAEAWSPGVLEEKQFDDAFSLHGLKDPSGRAMEAIRVIGKYLNNDSPSETTMTYTYLRQVFPSCPRNMIMNPSRDYFDRMAADIGRVRGNFNRVRTPYLRKVYELAGQMAWLGARKARLDAGYYGLGTEISQGEMKREAGKLAHDLRIGIGNLQKAWPETATTGGLDQTVASLKKIAQSLAGARFNSPPKKEDKISNPASAHVPEYNTGTRAILADIRHLKIIPHPCHHTMRAELSYDANDLHVRLIGNEPDMPKYKADRRLLKVLGLGSYFEIFLAPDPARPFCYGHLTVSVTGELLGRVGAPFSGIRTRSQIKDRDFIVDVLIPWKGMGGRPCPGRQWRGNFTYSVFKDLEFMTWAHLQRGYLESENFGILTFK